MATSEADELRDAVREFLEGHVAQHDACASSWPPRRVTTRRSGARWPCELGLHGIAVPEEWGGAGAGISELAVVFEEMGAALLCSPFFSTVALAAQAVLTSGDHGAMADYLPAFVDGTSTATLILNGRSTPGTPPR